MDCVLGVFPTCAGRHMTYVRVVGEGEGVWVRMIMKRRYFSIGKYPIKISEGVFKGAVSSSEGYGKMEISQSRPQSQPRYHD